MNELKRQLSFADVDEEYANFVEKFKPKKTTDDCYTPPLIYDTVAEYVAEKYGANRERFVRPFYPGGDYERYPYKDGDIVVDNPPFSILAKIVSFYIDNSIPFFLFAPYQTVFSGGRKDITYIVTGEQIEYENGAKVGTSFVTSLDGCLARADPDLSARIRDTMAKINQENKRRVPKYRYPDDVLTATMLGYMATHGVEYVLYPEDAIFIREMDDQRRYKKSLFGGVIYSAERLLRKRPLRKRLLRKRPLRKRLRLSPSSCLNGSWPCRKKWTIKEAGERELVIETTIGEVLDKLFWSGEELSRSAYNREAEPDNVQLKEHLDEVIEDIMRIHVRIIAEERKIKDKTGRKCQDNNMTRKACSNCRYFEPYHCLLNDGYIGVDYKEPTKCRAWRRKDDSRRCMHSVREDEEQES